MGISDKVTLVQLSEMKPLEGEEITDFIQRWKTASIRCEQQLQEDQAVQLVVGRITGWIKTFLCSHHYSTFTDLMEYVTNLQNSREQIFGGFQSMMNPSEIQAQSKPRKPSKGKPGTTMTIEEDHSEENPAIPAGVSKAKPT